MNTDNFMKDRIKEVRKQSKYDTQEKFAEFLGTTRAAIASYELGRVVPNDTFIQLLCTKCNISKNWLTTGIGEMHIESDEEIVTSLVQKFNMTDTQKKLMEIFLSMSDDKREMVATAFFSMCDAAGDVKKNHE